MQKWPAHRNLWPTPVAKDDGKTPEAHMAMKEKMGRKTISSLAVMVKAMEQGKYREQWPTPTVSDKGSGDYYGNGSPKLSGAVAKWPTPTAHNAKETAAPSEYKRNTPTLAAQAGGSLNPTWVEWLMAWPLGWTDCEHSATDGFRSWARSHGLD